jgi:DNA-binding HxlR family transcriptional regulator
MAEQQNGSSPACRGAGQVGDRWTVLLVEALLGGPQRFNDLLGQIPGDRRDVLAERLERLERDGLLIARPYSERTPRAAYQLTAVGTDLAERAAAAIEVRLAAERYLRGQAPAGADDAAPGLRMLSALERPGRPS